MSRHSKGLFFRVSFVSGSASALKLLINFRKYCTNPKKDCTYFTVVGYGHSLKLFTLASEIFKPSGVTLKPRNVALVRKKLHFFSLQ